MSETYKIKTKTLEAEIDELERQKEQKIRELKAALKDAPTITTKYTYVPNRPDRPRGACARCWDYDGSMANCNLYNGSGLCHNCFDATDPW